MKNIKSNIKKGMLISVGLILLSVSGKPQDSINIKSNYIGLSITELLFVDFRINYERRINLSNGLKFEIGYKPGFMHFTDATKIDFGQKPTAWCYRNTANWFYISLGYRYYFNHNKTIYFSPELFYKKLDADNIVYTWGINKGSSYLTNQYETRTMSATIFGTNLLIGKRFAFNRGNSNFGFDMFCGLSLRSKKTNTTIFGRTTVTYEHDSPPSTVTIPSYDKPIEIVENIVQPSFQFGIILFGSWK
jgi:hypothetical protein